MAGFLLVFLETNPKKGALKNDRPVCEAQENRGIRKGCIIALSP